MKNNVTPALYVTFSVLAAAFAGMITFAIDSLWIGLLFFCAVEILFLWRMHGRRQE
jgi:membrane protein implicated in regulation of membrane protease activity